MMKALLFLSFLVSGATAAPAIVWKKGATDSVVHSSESIAASSLFKEVSGARREQHLASAIFLLNRAEDGSESLSTLASSGALAGISQKYNDAHSIYSHVSGLESPHKVASDVAKQSSTETSSRVAQVTLEEFNRKLLNSNNNDVDDTNPRSRELNQADILVINCNADAATIDSAVVKAIESETVDTVVLAGIRSVEETKHERRLLAMKKAPTLVNAPRRRLEDADENDDAANNKNGDDDMEGVYYVLLTPNIFAGILFIIFFSVVAWTGINCMGEITGQDVFVHKMPPIGREA